MIKKNLSAVAIVTGASKRIGRQIAIELHQAGFQIAIHYHRSKNEAMELTQTLNHQRENSAIMLQADLLETQTLQMLIDKAVSQWGRLDLLVNNASCFFPTPINSKDLLQTENHWDKLMGVNLKAAYYLSLVAAPQLKKTSGSIINIVDIYGMQPLKDHSIYSIAKAGMIMMNKTLAVEFAPNIRVNGIAPGAILWPENDTSLDEEKQQKIIAKTAVKRQGSAKDIAATVRFLALDADYITGQIIRVDGGRF